MWGGEDSGTAAPTTTPSPRRRRPEGPAWGAAARAVCALVVLWGMALAGCGLAGAGARGGAPALYVSNGRDGTVTRLDGADGRVVGTTVPAGAAPRHLAVGPSGELLVQSAAVRAGAGLTYVAPASSGWQARPLPLEPGAHHPVLAGGGRFAVVAYKAGEVPAAGARCRAALVDLERRRVAAPRDVCAGRDSVVGLAADGDDALVYLALWRRPAPTEPCGGATGSRVAALRLDTGAVVATAPLDGVPGPLTLGPGPGGVGRRLYAVEALPSPEVARPGEPPTDCAAAGYGDLFEGAPGWRVLWLDAPTLAPEGGHTVPHLVRALAVTPDGRDAFVLAGRAAVLRLQPGGGPAAPFAVLPDLAMGLAATDARLYTLGVFRDRVWGLDRRRGDLVQTLPTGRGPVAIVARGSGSRRWDS